MNQNVLNVLLEARKLISSPNTFCQGTSARDSLGKPIKVDSPYAVCWCSIGAIRAASIKLFKENPEFEVSDVNQSWNVLYLTMGEGGISIFSDNNSYEIVLRAWDTAIELYKNGAKLVDYTPFSPVEEMIMTPLL